MTGKQRKERRTSQGNGDPSAFEWIAAGIGAVLVLGMIVLMVYEALTETKGPPQIEVAVDGISEVEGGYLVSVRTHNSGSTTAAGLVVEGRLRLDGGEVETSTTTIDYAPPNGDVKAGLFFSRNPRSGSLTLRPLGFQTP